MWRRLLFLIRRGEYTRDLNEEISQHLESKVQKLMLRRALMLALGGVVIGLFAAAGATRFMASLLVDVGAMDAPTFILVPIVLCASRVHPMVALRYE